MTNVDGLDEVEVKVTNVLMSYKADPNTPRSQSRGTGTECMPDVESFAVIKLPSLAKLL